jgi:hypothetical protein
MCFSLSPKQLGAKMHFQWACSAAQHPWGGPVTQAAKGNAKLVSNG